MHQAMKICLEDHSKPEKSQHKLASENSMSLCTCGRVFHGLLLSRVCWLELCLGHVEKKNTALFQQPLPDAQKDWRLKGRLWLQLSEMDHFQNKAKLTWNQHIKNSHWWKYQNPHVEIKNMNCIQCCQCQDSLPTPHPQPADCVLLQSVPMSACTG